MIRQTKHGDYEKRIIFEVYSYFVYVVFTDDLKKSVTARYPEIVVDGSEEAMHCRESGEPESHIFFKLGNCPMGNVAHESFHAVRYLLEDWTGCKLTNETVAYHLGYLVQKVSDFRSALIDAGLGIKSSTKKR